MGKGPRSDLISEVFLLSRTLRPLRRSLLALALVLPLCACADPNANFPVAPPDSGEPTVDGPVPCTEGAKRCHEKTFQTCVNGSFLDVQTCDASRICARTLGCVDCDPETGKVCSGNVVHACTKVGRVGEAIEDCQGRVCAFGACVDSPCAAEARLIYVVDATDRLLSFDPSKEGDPFTLIKEISCPTKLPSPDGAPPHPFSMAVDRSARAWVLYTSGELFWVSVKTGECKPSGYVPGQESFQLFGMGFVSDTPGSSKEKLYVANGALQPTPTPNNQLGYIDPSTMKLKTVGVMESFEYSPELSGTGNSELIAYYPGMNASYVTRVDKTTGKTLEKWPVTTLEPGEQVTAWAFAHWGGKYYIFVTGAVETYERPRVIRLDPKTGKSVLFRDNTSYKVVGAGVSICAPVID